MAMSKIETLQQQLIVAQSQKALQDANYLLQNDRIVTQITNLQSQIQKETVVTQTVQPLVNK